MLDGYTAQGRYTMVLGWWWKSKVFIFSCFLLPFLFFPTPVHLVDPCLTMRGQTAEGPRINDVGVASLFHAKAPNPCSLRPRKSSEKKKKKKTNAVEPRSGIRYCALTKLTKHGGECVNTSLHTTLKNKPSQTIITTQLIHPKYSRFLLRLINSVLTND